MHTLIAENLVLPKGKIDSTRPRPPRPNFTALADKPLSESEKIRWAGFWFLNPVFPTTSLPRQALEAWMNPWLESKSQSTGLRRVAAAVHPPVSGNDAG